jgi:FtsP/CotA-like multicopper oxidase with cupredoxin domain
MVDRSGWFDLRSRRSGLCALRDFAPSNMASTFSSTTSHTTATDPKVGELQVWDVINDTMMDHPFHLHGFFFQIVEVNGEPPQVRRHS